MAGAGGTIGGVSKIMSDAFRRISNGTTELTITSSDDENYELQSYEDGDPGEAGEGYTPEEALENYISSVTGKSYTMSPDERDLCIDALNRLVSEGGEKTAQIWQEEGEDTYTAMIYNDGNPAFTGSGKTPLEAFIDLGVD